MNLGITKRIFLYWLSVIIVIGGGSSSINAQFNIQWDKTFGGAIWEELNGVVPIPEENRYIFGGMTSSAGSYEVQSDGFGQWNSDCWIVWTDTLGNLLMEKRFGGFNNERIQNMIRTPDGNVLVIGSTDSGAGGNLENGTYGFLDYWVFKMRTDGTIIWEINLGGTGFDIGMAVAASPDNRYLICGHSNSNASGLKSQDSFGNMDIWTVLLDIDGNILWDQSYGGDSLETVTAATYAVDGGFIIGGSSFSTPGTGNKESTSPYYGKNDWWYFKIDDDGNKIWERVEGGAEQDDILDIITTNDGNYLFTGFSDTPQGNGTKTAPNYGKEDMWILKIDQSGDKIWEQSYGGGELDWAYSAVQNLIGNYVVCGVSVSGNDGSKDGLNWGGRDYWLLHLDGDGNKIWDQTFGGSLDDSCTKIERAIGGGYILGGHSQSGESQHKSGFNRGMNDMWVIKTGCPLGKPDLPDIINICEGTEVFVDASVDPCENCFYLWENGSENPIREIDTNVPFMEHSIIITHKDACEVLDTFIVETVPNPTALLVDVDSVSCFGESDGAIYVEGVEGGTPPYSLKLNNVSYNDLNDLPDLFNLASGTYEFEVLDSNNCFTDTLVVIETPDEPLVLLPDDITIELGDSLQIQALVNPVVENVVWNTPDLLSCEDCLEPWIAPKFTTVLGIIATDANGCEARDAMSIIINKNISVHVPNVFSPNGDGQNDFITVYSKNNIRDILEFKIFDRWGQMMFNRQNFPPNVAQLGWDGLFQGKPKKPGVYAYLLEVVYVDGRREIFNGDITLVR